MGDDASHPPKPPAAPSLPPWHSAEIERKIQWRTGDVVISVPAKSGTTWTMNIVHQLREGGDPNLEDVYADVTWLSVIDAPGRTVDDMVQKIDGMPRSRPRAFKTHSSPPRLPFRDDVKYVVVCRNPEEALCSLLPFMNKKSPEFLDLWGVPQERRQYFSDFATFYSDFVTKTSFSAQLFDFVSEWWKLRDCPNVLMLHYTNMLEDHEGTIRKISNFLGYGPYDDEQWRTILECTSFIWMKKHEVKFEGTTIFPVPVLRRGAMIRQGSSGLSRKEGMTEEMAKDLAARGRKILTNAEAFDWFYNGDVALQGPSTLMTLEDMLANGDSAIVKLEVNADRALRKPEDLSEEMRLQLAYIVEGSFYFGDPKLVKTVEDCFNRKYVDDGIVFYKEMKSTVVPDVVFHYWLGYFGGNPTGYLLRQWPSRVVEDSKDAWDVLIENCDTDFIWRGEGEEPKAFIKNVKMAAYGDKYCEEEDAEELRA